MTSGVSPRNMANPPLRLVIGAGALLIAVAAMLV